MAIPYNDLLVYTDKGERSPTVQLYPRVNNASAARASSIHTPSCFGCLADSGRVNMAIIQILRFDVNIIILWPLVDVLGA